MLAPNPTHAPHRREASFRSNCHHRRFLKALHQVRGLNLKCSRHRPVGPTVPREPLTRRSVAVDAGWRAARPGRRALPVFANRPGTTRATLATS